MPVVQAAGLSDVGQKRKGNEDAYYLDDELNVYVVADGMGGRNAGEVASQLTVETIRDYMKGWRGNLESELLTDDPKNLSREARRLVTSIHLANQEVYQLSNSKPDVQGMGTTVSAVFVLKHKFIVSNVGDSPIYVVRDNKIRMISIPHTMMAEHAAMAPKGAKPLSPKYRHVLTRAIGINEKAQPDTREYRFEINDILVICSDGLSDKVTPEEIMERVIEKEPERACRSLVNLANSRGGEDNITVIVMKILADQEAAKPEAQTPTVDQNRQPEAAPPPSASDPGATQTVWVDCKIPVEYDTEEASYTGNIVKISMSSLMIETQEAFKEGQELSMVFKPGEGQEPTLFSGRVLRRTPEGIRVKFTDLDAEQTDLLTRMLSG